MIQKIKWSQANYDLCLMIYSILEDKGKKTLRKIDMQRGGDRINRVTYIKENKKNGEQINVRVYDDCNVQMI